MTVSLPLVFVLGVIAWAAIKFLGIRLWVAVVIALFGFLTCPSPTLRLPAARRHTSPRTFRRSRRSGLTFHPCR